RTLKKPAARSTSTAVVSGSASSRSARPLTTSSSRTAVLCLQRIEYAFGGQRDPRDPLAGRTRNGVPDRGHHRRERLLADPVDLAELGVLEQRHRRVGRKVAERGQRVLGEVCVHDLALIEGDFFEERLT